MKTSIHLHHIKANPFIFYFLYTDSNVHFYNNQTRQFLQDMRDLQADWCGLVDLPCKMQPIRGEEGDTDQTLLYCSICTSQGLAFLPKSTHTL